MRTILVTGASRGVGRETSRSLVLDHGCTVHAVSRDRVALEQLQQECASAGHLLKPLVMDITAENASEELRAQLAGVALNGIVHNAGTLLKRNTHEYRRNELQQLFLTNVIAPLELTSALRTALVKGKTSHVVHIGSMGGFQDSAKFPGLAAYSSSKAAMACLSQCLAEEFKEEDIRCNCLAIGAVDTTMLREAFPGYKAPVSAEAMGRYVADFVLHGHYLYNAKVLPVAVSTP
ncbi:MAG: SDR family oxidoreductase [Flavobacteriales bacterium]|nr:SDR family oxidoreductase [Flavobacteriales bacterium]